MKSTLHATASGNGCPITTNDGLGGVKEIKSKIRLPLIPYFCPADAIHSFVPQTKYAMSIVLFGTQTNSKGMDQMKITRKVGDKVRVENPRTRKFLYAGEIIEINGDSARVKPNGQSDKNAGTWRLDWLK